MGRGVINLTDGAAPYESFAGGEVVCSPDCERADCLERAKLAGKTTCLGSRPRVGRPSYNKHYKHLSLSHGVVSHKKEEWAVVKKVVVFHSGSWVQPISRITLLFSTRSHASVNMMPINRFSVISQTITF